MLFRKIILCVAKTQIWSKTLKRTILFIIFFENIFFFKKMTWNIIFWSKIWLFIKVFSVPEVQKPWKKRFHTSRRVQQGQKWLKIAEKWSNFSLLGQNRYLSLRTLTSLSKFLGFLHFLVVYAITNELRTRSDWFCWLSCKMKEPIEHPPKLILQNAIGLWKVKSSRK